jgi:hypothetical protein
VLSAPEFQINSTGTSMDFKMYNLPGWAFGIATPSTLAPGVYQGAGLYPSQAPGQPGLYLTASTGCNLITGRFIIGQAIFTAGVLQRLHVRFEQHCNNWSVAARGEFWYDVGGSTSPPPLTLPPPPSTPTSFFSYQSDPGDAIGGGGSQTITIAGGKFLPEVIASQPAVYIRLESFTGASFIWDMHLASLTGQRLQPGTYLNATKYGAQAAGTPGLSIMNAIRCTSITGKFVVLEAVYGPSSEIYRFHATFEQHCDGAVPALKGEIRIVADPWR